MERKKTLVVDVDDTISRTENRDYANSIPYTSMIRKLNNLYDNGWDVIYFTARGQLSANKDLEVINNTRLPVLVKWMEDNGVKYTEVLFGKPFGDYYIDDKAIRPDEFLGMSFDNFEGRSGAEVSRVGDLVIKVAENTQMQVDWYNHNQFVLAPRVVDNAPSVYRMEYIDGTPGWLNLQASTIVQAVEAIKSFKDNDPMPGYSGLYDDYLERCIRKLPGAMKHVIRQIAGGFNPEQSFCHGDLTLTNMIVKPDGQVYFIDPSIQKDIWSSYMIDVGRLMQSLRGRYEEKFLGAPIDDTKSVYVPYILEQVSIDEEDADIMELLIHCRIWHHQKRHSVADGKETMKQIWKLIEKLQA